MSAWASGCAAQSSGGLCTGSAGCGSDDGPRAGRRIVAFLHAGIAAWRPGWLCPRCGEDIGLDEIDVPPHAGEPCRRCGRVQEWTFDLFTGRGELRCAGVCSANRPRAPSPRAPPIHVPPSSAWQRPDDGAGDHHAPNAPGAHCSGQSLACMWASHRRCPGHQFLAVSSAASCGGGRAVAAGAEPMAHGPGLCVVVGKCPQGPVHSKARRTRSKALCASPHRRPRGTGSCGAC